MGNICGDGDRDVANETCDDGNTDPCGLCAAGCGSARTYAAATGSFTVASDGTLTGDGDSFTLDDGINPAVTFELDSDSDCPDGGPTGVVETPTFRCVPFVDGTPGPADTAGEIATSIRNAINSASITLDINATRSGADITLTNNAIDGNGNGATGNTAIESSDFPSGWMFSASMTGGFGRNCASGTGCTSDDDCASADCAVDNTCAP